MVMNMEISRVDKKTLRRVLWVRSVGLALWVVSGYGIFTTETRRSKREGGFLNQALPGAADVLKHLPWSDPLRLYSPLRWLSQQPESFPKA
jgi:hypothetical protein